ncbi:MAG: organic solvent tolerance protein [Oligoflexia bacterium]|nr:organic solvent tolerance protein [Oligoflexia bacterium]
MKHLTYVLAIFGLFIFQTAEAKDMTSRLGVGYSDSFSAATMPSLAVKYYASQDFALSAALGIDTNSTNSSAGGSNFGFGAKVYKTIFPEDNLNFYMGAGAALVTIGGTNGGASSSGFELNGFAGCELFFPGLDSVGINFQAGVGVTSVSSGVRFRTIGDTPFKAGMYFYF